MNIISLFSAVTNNDKGLSIILDIVSNTLLELNINLNNINLAYSSIPYFDGSSNNNILNIKKDIKKADGVIIFTTTPYGMPSSILQTFFEYLQIEENKDLFNDKICMLIVYSNNTFGLNNISYVIRSLGAYDVIRIEIDKNFINQINKNDFYKKYIEIQVEDFYRIVNQKRKFYLPNKNNNVTNNLNINNINKEANNFLQVIKNINTDQTFLKKDYNSHKINEIYNNIAIENFNKSQQEDIDNIAKVFLQKFNNTKQDNTISNKNENNFLQPLLPNISTKSNTKSCKQLTISLTHFYKPQIIPDINATIQLNIYGEENFTGYIIIKNKFCEYIDGTVDSPSVTIIAEDTIWKNIITGKITAQKAFIIGQIKVRGNFIIITKLDKIFSFKKNVI